MFEVLKRLYQEGRLTEQLLQNAITRKWVTEEQGQEIRDSKVN